jgi:hypothetical protein
MIIPIITRESKYLAKHVKIPKIDDKRIDIKRIFPFQQLKKKEIDMGLELNMTTKRYKKNTFMMK